MQGETERKKTFDRESKRNHVMLPCQRNGTGVQLISITGVLQWKFLQEEAISKGNMIFDLFGIDHGPQLQYINFKYMHENSGVKSGKNHKSGR